MLDKKHFLVNSVVYDTYEAAEQIAKRLVTKKDRYSYGVVVYEAVATVKAPLPAAEVTKLTS